MFMRIFRLTIKNYCKQNYFYTFQNILKQKEN